MFCQYIIKIMRIAYSCIVRSIKYIIDSFLILANYHSFFKGYHFLWKFIRYCTMQTISDAAQHGKPMKMKSKMRKHQKKT